MEEDKKSQRDLRAELTRLETALADQNEWLKNWHLEVVGNSTAAGDTDQSADH